MSKPSGSISELQDLESIEEEVYLQQPSGFCGLNSVGNYPTLVLNQPPPLRLYNGYPHLQLFHGQSFPGASIPVIAQAAANNQFLTNYQLGIYQPTLPSEIQSINGEASRGPPLPNSPDKSLHCEIQPLITGACESSCKHEPSDKSLPSANQLMNMEASKMPSSSNALDKSTLITEQPLNNELCSRCQMPKGSNDSSPIEMQPLNNETFGRTSQPDSSNSRSVWNHPASVHHQPSLPGNGHPNLHLTIDQSTHSGAGQHIFTISVTAQPAATSHPSINYQLTPSQPLPIKMQPIHMEASTSASQSIPPDKCLYPEMQPIIQSYDLEKSLPSKTQPSNMEKLGSAGKPKPFDESLRIKTQSTNVNASKRIRPSNSLDESLLIEKEDYSYRTLLHFSNHRRVTISPSPLDDPSTSPHARPKPRRLLAAERFDSNDKQPAEI
ncbi:hypothetical protein V9T40_010121 [Parthenolecanium corni]|uniref:Uncharacterized protein n=1 Tax=Parthenolecanium corni TaxID=536013 RepID=A0AAN9TP38_9HEMI